MHGISVDITIDPIVSSYMRQRLKQSQQVFKVLRENLSSMKHQSSKLEIEKELTLQTLYVVIYHL